MTTKTVAPTTIPLLGPDLCPGLRRLTRATVRRTAAEVLQVAKTQRSIPGGGAALDAGPDR